ncbi:MAG: T9SS type A sorting domain-containing protein [Chitinophagaceae bacterium]|nr:T9SS type A sorting domain-containing protein [Chitinophagaceae bacterium]
MKHITTKISVCICCLVLSASIAFAADPTTSAPAPTQQAADVISLFSNAYSNVPIDTWSAVWDAADVSDYVIGTSDSVKKYSNLSFCGIEFTTNTINANSMTRFHVNMWTPDATFFKIKLVDFGADGLFGGGDDSEHELTYNTTTSPAVVVNSWITFDIPLSSFTGLTSKQHLAQLLFVSAGNTAFIDNVYLYNGAIAPTSPSVSAPTPTELPSKVVSLFSNAYSNVPVDTWSAVWDLANLSSYVIGSSDSIKKYTNLVFSGTEFTTQTVDASNLTYFHLDIWTPDASTFNIKLVDFGADGLFGGGDDSEHELAYNATTSPAVVTNAWVSFDIPLANFTNLTSRGHLAQLLFVSGGNTVFVDNVYFFKGKPAGSTHEVSDYQIVPNPAIDWMNVHQLSGGGGLREMQQVTIYDLYGRLWYNAPVVSGNINVAALPHGIYRLGFNSENVKYDLPFIKQ